MIAEGGGRQGYTPPVLIECLSTTHEMGTLGRAKCEEYGCGFDVDRLRVRCFLSHQVGFQKGNWTWGSRRSCFSSSLYRSFFPSLQNHPDQSAATIQPPHGQLRGHQVPEPRTHAE